MHKIGEVARRVGCSIEAVRFYEQKGLLPAPSRSNGGHRLYPESSIVRLDLIRGARELGFSIEQISDVLHAMETPAIACQTVRQIAIDHLDIIDFKLEKLRSYRNRLVELIDNCPGEIHQKCKILESLVDVKKSPASA